MSQENTQQLLIDSQESSSQGDYLPKRKIQHLESPESPQPSDVDAIDAHMETSESESKPTPDVANVAKETDDIKRFEKETIIVTSKEKKEIIKCCYIDAFLDMCEKLKSLDA
jgi:hypothetical protein